MSGETGPRFLVLATIIRKTEMEFSADVRWRGFCSKQEIGGWEGGAAWEVGRYGVQPLRSCL